MNFLFPFTAALRAKLPRPIVPGLTKLRYIIGKKEGGSDCDSQEEVTLFYFNTFSSLAHNSLDQ